MEKEKIMQEIDFYLKRLGERELDILRRVAINLHQDMGRR
jgi:hypothetical protein